MKEKLNIPNSITIFRIILVVPITICLIKNQYRSAVLLFFLAALSDVLDGWLARKLKMQTRIGAVLDPLADKLMLNYTFVVLTIKSYIPLMLFATILTKDIILVVGSTIEVLSVNEISNIKIKASITGKISTFLQVIVITLVFLKIFRIYFDSILFSFLVYTTMVFAIFSLLSYIKDYLKRVQEDEK